ncbi:MAG TPA: succinylglutamate desuccinylase [Noviherbaspirillum sp.]|uniref:succinylglutamate desuccinylase n=1 Tax=Noviherbaspirillum sp. TaxID=1926288 RepID=UPI002B48C1E3|nr:succinylglutamate desuccinylase [Noviherbaspirillum sp.]HJV85902.1 succinylglutamate desuccinylase [Noviherbaspirillum sp.]
MMDRDLQGAVRALAAGDMADIAGCFAGPGHAVESPARGILQIRASDGGQHRPRLLLSVGVHGDETAPIEMLAHILHHVAAEPQALAVDLMVAVGNLAAIAQGKRFIDVDLNRLFRADRGELGKAAEATRADELMRAAASFLAGADGATWHLDLHAAIRPSLYPTFAVVPAIVGEPQREMLMQWLGAAGIGAAIVNPASASTFSAFTAEGYGAGSATVELGQIGTLGQNDLRPFDAARGAIDAFLRRGKLPVAPARPRVFRVAQELIKRSDAFRMAFDGATKNFTPMQPGTVIAMDGDTVYRVGPVMEYVVFPNPDVRVGLRAGLMVVEQE